MRKGRGVKTEIECFLRVVCCNVPNIYIDTGLGVFGLPDEEGVSVLMISVLSLDAGPEAAG